MSATADTAQALVPHAPPDTPAAIFEELDHADEEQIVAEIVEGTLVDKLAYEFEAGTGSQRKKVRGLSYTGVNWCVREMAVRGIGRIGIKSVAVNEARDPDGNPVYEALVIARDEMLGTENVGMADAELYPSTRAGGTYTDRHAKRKAVSKAQRNAKAGLVPELLKAELLAKVTTAQLQLVQTRRQRSETVAERVAQRRVERTTAKPPKATEALANAAQRRLIFAKAKAAGCEDEPQQRAIVQWISGAEHSQRIPKAKVDDLIAAFEAYEHTLTDIHDHANDPKVEGHDRAKAIVDRYLKAG